VQVSFTIEVPDDYDFGPPGNATNPPYGGINALVSEATSIDLPDISDAQTVNDQQISDMQNTWRHQLAQLSAMRAAWELILSQRLDAIAMKPID